MAIGDQLHRLESAAPEEVESTVEALIEVLAQPDRFGREPILATLKTTGDPVVPTLLASISQPTRLRQPANTLCRVVQTYRSMKAIARA